MATVITAEEERLNTLTTLHSEDEMLSRLASINALYGMETNNFNAMGTNGFLHFVLMDQYSTWLYRSNVAINENHVITARRLSSMYKHAASHDIIPTYATPANMSFLLIFDVDEFYRKADRVGDTFTYTISKDNYISVGTFRYSLDYDVEISIQIIQGVPNVLVQYVVDQTDKNPISDVTDRPIIKYTWYKVTEKINKLYIDLDLKQYYKKRTSLTFNNREYDAFYVKAPNGEEVATLDILWYSLSTNNTNDKLTRLNKRLYFEAARDGEPSIFIRYLESNTSVDIIHKASVFGFTPVVGDYLYVDMYLTKGERGNFTRSSLSDTDIIFRYDENTDKGLRFQVLLNPKNTNSNTVSSTGGKSFDESVESLRKQVITKRSTRDSIVIENDLTQILNGLAKSNSKYNEYAVVKYRNDILKLFNIFTTIRFNQDTEYFTIPTNTLNITWNYMTNSKVMDPGQYLLDMRTVSSYEALVGQFEDITVPNWGEVGQPSAGGLGYIFPFIMLYDKNKNMVRVYDSYMDEFRWTQCTFMYDSIPYAFIINKATLRKEDAQSQYSFLLQVRTSLSGTKPLETIHSYDSSDNIVDEDFLRINLEIYDADENLLVTKKAIMIDYNDGSDDTESAVPDDFYTYEIIFHKDDELYISDDKMRIYEDDGITPVMIPMETTSCIIRVNSPTVRDSSGVLATDRKDTALYEFDFNILHNRSADYKIQHNILNVNEIKMFNVPLIAYYFYKDHKAIFRRELINEYDNVSILYNYQGEFSYSIKFANTYGYSNSYIVGYESNVEKLNNVMLDMKFIVSFARGIDINFVELNKLVYDYVNNVDFVKLETLHISDIIAGIKNTYPDMVPILQFDGMNGLDVKKQTIQMNIDQIQNDTVIEKLNIPFVYDDITKKFSHVIDWYQLS